MVAFNGWHHTSASFQALPFPIFPSFLSFFSFFSLVPANSSVQGSKPHFSKMRSSDPKLWFQHIGPPQQQQWSSGPSKAGAPPGLQEATQTKPPFCFLTLQSAHLLQSFLPLLQKLLRQLCKLLQGSRHHSKPSFWQSGKQHHTFFS